MKLPLSRNILRIPWGVDWSLFIVPLVLSVLGIVIIFSVTYTTNPTLMISQIIFVVLGFTVAILLSLVDYRSLKGISFFLYLAVTILLLAVLFFGHRTFGASRWLNLGVFQLQPSEIAKLVVLIFLSKFLADAEKFDFKKILAMFAIVGIP